MKDLGQATDGGIIGCVCFLRLSVLLNGDLSVGVGSGLLREQVSEGGKIFKFGHAAVFSFGADGDSDDEGSHRGSERESKEKFHLR